MIGQYGQQVIWKKEVHNYIPKMKLYINEMGYFILKKYTYSVKVPISGDLLHH